LARGFSRRCCTEPVPGSFKRKPEALFRYWFQQIVDSVDFERANGVLVVGSYKYYDRHLVCSDRFDDGETIHTRHLDVEQYEIRRLVADLCY
jgi:hypothetical protein